MEEEIKMYLDEAQELMHKAVEHTQREISKIRAGKADPSMLDSLKVEYYGAETPLNQLASVTTSDARTILIKPFERNLINSIEKAIKNSDLGFNPQNDGQSIRINIPPLTEERRRQLVKQVKQEGESGKVSIRNIRKDTNGSLKELQKEGASEDAVKKAEEEVQKLTDKFVVKVEEILSKKETELMTV
ncbi:MAG: ribosome recycling factor [Microscillaceae bacterium]|nr:ribosome recycling factor [Microscillaceae bacterium]